VGSVLRLMAFTSALCVSQLSRICKTRIHILLYWPRMNASGDVRGHELGEVADLWRACRLNVLERVLFAVRFPLDFVNEVLRCVQRVS
jgi:hypothetical protein